MNKDVQVTDRVNSDLDEGTQVALVDILTWLGEAKTKIAGVTIVATAAAVAISLSMPNEYTAKTTLLPPNAQQQSGSSAALAALGSLGGLAGSVAGKTPDELYVQLLRSDTVLRALDKRFDLRKRYEAKTHEILRSRLAGHVRINGDKKSGVISVEADDTDPQFAADLANAHAAEITKLLSRLAVTEAQQRRIFFEQQLKDAKENLIAAEQSLRQVQEKSGMVVLDKQAEAIIGAVAQVKTRIAEREVQLRVLRTTTTPQNPQVRMLEAELAALRSEVARMESSAGGGGKDSREGGIDIPIGKLPSAAIEYVRAVREVKFQETMLASMLRQFEAAKLDEAKDAPALQQVDVALPPDQKSKPGRSRIVLVTMLAAIVLTSAWVIVRRFGRLANEQDPGRARAYQAMGRAWRLRRSAT